MKKILKKVIATVAAFAFAAAGLVVAPKTAKAAGTTVKVYVELTAGKTAEYYIRKCLGRNCKCSDRCNSS